MQRLKSLIQLKRISHSANPPNPPYILHQRHTYTKHPHTCPAMHLPITVYQYDRRTKEYLFSHCLSSSVPSSLPPTLLNCSSGMGILRDGLELLKAAMRAPALVLINGTRSKVLSASGEEIGAMPPVSDASVIYAFEMICINIPSCILHYRLRRDGALVLVSSNEDVNCLTCHVPETLSISYVKKHLAVRAESIRKLIRDRRIVVEMGARTSVYSLDTLHRRCVLVSAEKNNVYK